MSGYTSDFEGKPRQPQVHGFQKNGNAQALPAQSYRRVAIFEFSNVDAAASGLPLQVNDESIAQM